MPKDDTSKTLFAQTYTITFIIDYSVLLYREIKILLVSLVYPRDLTRDINNTKAMEQKALMESLQGY